MTQQTQSSWNDITLTDCVIQERSNKVPQTQQAIFDAVMAKDASALQQVIVPSRTRSKLLTETASTHFHPEVFEILVDAGWINPELSWKTLLGLDNAEALGWWLATLPRVRALEDAVGSENVRDYCFHNDESLSGTKSLMGAGGAFEALDIWGQGRPKSFIQVCLMADWGGILRGNLKVFSVADVLSSVISHGANDQVPDTMFRQACERLFDEATLSRVYPLQTQKSEIRQNQSHWLNRLRASLIIPFQRHMVSAPFVETAKIQKIIQQSPILSESFDAFWSPLPSNYYNSNIDSMILGQRNLSFNYVENNYIHIWNLQPGKGGCHFEGWLDSMIAHAAPTVVDLFQKNVSSPPLDAFRKKVIERMLEKPELLIFFCKNIPSDALGSVLNTLLPSVRDINPGGSSMAHLVLSARPTLTAAESLTRMTPPVDVINLTDHLGKAPIWFLDDKHKNEATLLRLQRNIARASRNALNAVASVSKPSRVREAPKM